MWTPVDSNIWGNISGTLSLPLKSGLLFYLEHELRHIIWLLHPKWTNYLFFFQELRLLVVPQQQVHFLIGYCIWTQLLRLIKQSQALVYLNINYFLLITFYNFKFSTIYKCLYCNTHTTNIGGAKLFSVLLCSVLEFLLY